MEMIVVDSFESPLLAGQYNVFSNPTILVFFDGKEFIRKSKYIAVSELQSEIDRYYQMVFD